MYCPCVTWETAGLYTSTYMCMSVFVPMKPQLTLGHLSQLLLYIDLFPSLVIHAAFQRPWRWTVWLDWPVSESPGSAFMPAPQVL